MIHKNTYIIYTIPKNIYTLGRNDEAGFKRTAEEEEVFFELSHFSSCHFGERTQPKKNRKNFEVRLSRAAYILAHPHAWQERTFTINRILCKQKSYTFNLMRKVRELKRASSKN